PPRPPGVCRISGRRQAGKSRAGLRARKAGPPAYSRPAGARVALLQSPTLPTAPRKIPGRGHAVQPRITPGARASRACDTPLTADISIGEKSGHFYWGLTKNRPAA